MNMNRILNILYFTVGVSILFSCPGQIFGGIPVLVWESSSTTDKSAVVPALWQLDSGEFSNHVTKKVHVHKPLIVLFLEETLSTEDFSWQDAERSGSFPKLKNITGMSARMEFILSVESPSSALRELTTSQGYRWMKYDRTNLPDKPGVILEVKMNDPFNNEDRPTLLRRHDGNIAEIYSQLLAKHSHIVAIFTGKQSSWVELESNRVRRAAPPATDELRFESQNFLMETSRLELTWDSNIVNLSSKLNSTDDASKTNIKTMTVTLTADPNENPATNISKVILRFNFTISDKVWQLNNLKSEVVIKDKLFKKNLVPDKSIKSPIGNSFYSTTPTLFSGENSTLIMYNLRVQYFPSPNQGQLKTFATAMEDETVYFTGPIWSGIVVSWVLIIILTWGITMLMDIKTMDRFDDPKGKTISVQGAGD